MCSAAHGRTHRQTDRQTHTKVTTEGTLSGFQEFFLQPIIKNRPKKTSSTTPSCNTGRSVALSRKTICLKSHFGEQQLRKILQKNKWASVVLYSLSTISGRGPVGSLKSSVTFCSSSFSLLGPGCKSTITWSAGFASTILTFSKIPHNTLSNVTFAIKALIVRLAYPPTFQKLSSSPFSF